MPREVECGLARVFESKESMPAVTDVTMLGLPLVRARECTDPAKTAKAEQQKRKAQPRKGDEPSSRRTVSILRSTVVFRYIFPYLTMGPALLLV